MSSLPWLCLPLLLASWGCTVTAVSGKEDARPKNSCAGSESCADGDSCLGGICQSLNGKLEALLLTASPSGESTVAPLTYVTHWDELQTAGAAKEVVWPGPARVNGTLILPKGHCYPEFISDEQEGEILESKDGSLPATVTLTLRQRSLGIPQQRYFGTTVTAPVRGYFFDMQVPSGEYDVYLVPPKRQKGTCVVPPQLFRGVAMGVGENSAQNGVYRFNLAAVSELNLHVLWPESAPSLTSWVADIIEPLGGNPISTEVVLGAANEGRAGKVDYAIPLAYSAVTDPAATDIVNAARDLLRFRPPPGTVAPTIYLERSGLGVLQDPGDAVNLTIFSRIPAPVTVLGQMVRKDDGIPVGGEITLVSKKIYGVDDGVFGSFRTTLAVDDDGLVELRVPPGQYAIEAVPRVTTDSSLSVLEAEWEIPEDVSVQFGKLLEVTQTTQVKGQSRTPGAQVQADPPPSIIRPFEEAFGFQPFIRRSSGSFADDSGAFVLQVDELEEGRLNLTVMAPEDLGFGWFVRPGLELGRGGQDLGRVTLPVPAALTGQASLLDGGTKVPLGSAIIRAYAYLDKDFKYTRDPSAAETVVQVAQTRADAQGAFRLLLPSSLATQN